MLRTGVLSLVVVLGCGPAVSLEDEDADDSSSRGSGSMSGSAATESSGSLPPSGSDSSPTSPVSSAEGGLTTGDATDDPFDDSGAVTTGIGGCDAVDILFVVDSSGEMDEVQERWLVAVDAVVADIAETFAEQRLHVGVLTPEDGSGFNECWFLGELRAETVWGPCLPPDGPRFVTNDNLTEDLTCLLDVGHYGTGLEYMVTGAIAALSDELAQPGECNEGFLRDEAVLGIFFISNDPSMEDFDDDAHPDADTSTWYADLLAAKDDDMSAIVTVGLIAQSPSHCYSIYGGANENLAGLIDQFGMWGQRSSICEDDLRPALAAGVELLAETCDVWVP